MQCAGAASPRSRFLEHVRTVELERDRALEEARGLRSQLFAARADHRGREAGLSQQTQLLRRSGEETQAQEKALQSEVIALHSEIAHLKAARGTERSELLASLGVHAGPIYRADVGALSEALGGVARARDEAKEANAALRSRYTALLGDHEALAARLKAADREGARTSAALRAARQQCEEARQRREEVRQGLRQELAVQLALTTAVTRERDEFSDALAGTAADTRALCAELHEASSALEVEATEATEAREQCEIFEAMVVTRQAEIVRLEGLQEEAVRREIAWRSDLATRVHEAFVGGSLASSGVPSPCADARPVAVLAVSSPGSPGSVSTAGSLGQALSPGGRPVPARQLLRGLAAPGARSAATAARAPASGGGRPAARRHGARGGSPGASLGANFSPLAVE